VRETKILFIHVNYHLNYCLWNWSCDFVSN